MNIHKMSFEALIILTCQLAQAYILSPNSLFQMFNLRLHTENVIEACTGVLVSAQRLNVSVQMLRTLAGWSILALVNVYMPVFVHIHGATHMCVIEVKHFFFLGFY